MFSMNIAEGETASFNIQLLLNPGFTSVILAIRTWAIWRRCRIIATLLISLTIIGLAFQSYCIARFGVYLTCKLHISRTSPNTFTVATPPFKGYRGCFITRANPILIWNYVILIIIEAGICFLLYGSWDSRQADLCSRPDFNGY